MNILFISNDLIAGDLARVLYQEGNDVKLYIHDRKRRQNLEGLVPKTNSWKKELEWVGKDGLIVFDDVLFGKEQTMLRKQGYSVFGGSEIGDRFELDRSYSQDIFNKYGINTVPLYDFFNIDSAVEFIKAKGGSWVVKQNNHHYSKKLSYVGKYEDGRDTVNFLESIRKNTLLNNQRISLQERVIGVEIGCGRYFNGKDWVGPIEINLEHTRLYPNGIGPITSEMGTLAWYSDDESEPIFKNTIEKIKPYLQEIDFRGDIEVNCIVNESGLYALEPTARFGSPIIHLQVELHKSPWAPFLKGAADGQITTFEYKKGYGLVTLIAVPPFPFIDGDINTSMYGVNLFLEKLSKDDWKHIHFEEVSKKTLNSKDFYQVSDHRGYVAYVTSVADSVVSAHQHTLDMIDRIHIPKMFYREDIGLKFINGEEELLKKWGYIR